MNLNNSIIVKMSLTRGTLSNFISCDKIEAAKIGNVAFLDPDIGIFPEICFLPFISNFCI